MNCLFSNSNSARYQKNKKPVFETYFAFPEPKLNCFFLYLVPHVDRHCFTFEFHSPLFPPRPQTFGLLVVVSFISVQGSSQGRGQHPQGLIQRALFLVTSPGPGSGPPK
eukprot:EG_transcript_18615